MLISFEIENFYSIKNLTRFDFRVPGTAPDEPDRFTNLPFYGGIRIPKVISFFGPNASGKTTILRALWFVSDFIAESFEDYKSDQRIMFRPFASEKHSKSKTKIKVDFCNRDLDTGEAKLYSYELNVKNEGLSNNYVALESLIVRDERDKPTKLFERIGTKKGSRTKTHKDFKIKESDPRLNVRNNCSLISSLVQFAHKPSEAIKEAIETTFFSNVIVNKVSNEESKVIKLYKNAPPVLDRLNHFIGIADLGVEEIFIDKLGDEDTAWFRHRGLERPEPLYFESQGTKNFFCVFPDLALALGTGGMAIMDEIDSDLHPSLMAEIVSWFHDTENRRDAQLVMTCHNPSLLHYLIKEEVWLVEKSADGATESYPLSSIKGLRRDTNLYKKYTGGALGGIPNLG